MVLGLLFGFRGLLVKKCRDRFVLSRSLGITDHLTDILVGDDRLLSNARIVGMADTASSTSGLSDSSGLNTRGSPRAEPIIFTVYRRQWHGKTHLLARFEDSDFESKRLIVTRNNRIFEAENAPDAPV